MNISSCILIILAKTSFKKIIYKKIHIHIVGKATLSFVGENLMGLAIMEIRDQLADIYENYNDIDWDVSGEPFSKVRCSCGHVHKNV